MQRTFYEVVRRGAHLDMKQDVRGESLLEEGRIKQSFERYFEGRAGLGL